MGNVLLALGIATGAAVAASSMGASMTPVIAVYSAAGISALIATLLNGD